MKQIYLLGIGRNTPVFIDLAEQCGFEIIGLYHYNSDRTGEIDHGFKIIGSFDDLFTSTNLSGKNFLLTMGDNSIRSDIANKIRLNGGSTPTLIHPTAVISRFAILEEGVIVSPFTYIQANSIIKKDTIILSGVNISHNNKIGVGCFIAGGATVGAYTTVGNHVFIGQGVMTISGKVNRIGDFAYIVAGSLVTKSIGDNQTVVGRPAKIINNNL